MEERLDYRILNTGSAIPAIGYGTYKTGFFEESATAVHQALKTGYRLLDTAQFYNNEDAVGEGIKRSGISRHDIFITTKVWHNHAGYDSTLVAVEDSLRKLDTSYLDMVLVHQPIGDYYGTWRAFERLYDEGVIRAIGVSNFYEDRLIDLLYHCNVPPAVDQIECHLFNQRKSLIDVMRAHKVVPQAWSPFTRGKLPIFEHPVLRSLSEKYGKSMYQIILRWHIQRGVIPLPKAADTAHMVNNLDVFNFKLSLIDMDVLATLDQRNFLENHHTVAGLERLLRLD